MLTVQRYIGVSCFYFSKNHPEVRALGTSKISNFCFNNNNPPKIYTVFVDFIMINVMLFKVFDLFLIKQETDVRGFLKQTFNFEIITDSHAVVGNIRRYPRYLLPSFYQWKFCKTVVHIITGRVALMQSRYTAVLQHKDPSCFLSKAASLPSLLPHPRPLATTNLFSISTILSFQESYINGTILYVTLLGLALWFDIMWTRFLLQYHYFLVWPVIALLLFDIPRISV